MFQKLSSAGACLASKPDHLRWKSARTGISRLTKFLLVYHAFAAQVRRPQNCIGITPPMWLRRRGTLLIGYPASACFRFRPTGKSDVGCDPASCIRARRIGRERQSMCGLQILRQGEMSIHIP